MRLCGIKSCAWQSNLNLRELNFAFWENLRFLFISERVSWDQLEGGFHTANTTVFLPLQVFSYLKQFLRRIGENQKPKIKSSQASFLESYLLLLTQCESNSKHWVCFSKIWKWEFVELNLRYLLLFVCLFHLKGMITYVYFSFGLFNFPLSFPWSFLLEFCTFTNSADITE